MNETQANQHRIRKIVFWIVSILIVLLVVLGITVYNFYTSSLEPKDVENTEMIEVNIPMGSSRTEIATILEDEEIINNASTFNMYIRMNEESGFQAGYYDFSPSMSTAEIIDKLKEGGRPIPKEGWTIAIPEGITLRQIAAIISENTSYNEEEIMEMLDSKEFTEASREKFPQLLESAFEPEGVLHLLEGYLYPATYGFNEDTPLEDILSEMLKKTDDILQSYYDEIDQSDYTVHEIMTIASYIEREGIDYEDRRKISGVFYNRLEIDMPLQTDVSVTYALGEHKERISYTDLEIDSPYNTYKYKGIGPGPVNNPSDGAIGAALDPEETDYLFFLADLETKNVYFSEDYQEHLKYKAEYLDE